MLYILRAEPHSWWILPQPNVVFRLYKYFPVVCCLYSALGWGQLQQKWVEVRIYTARQMRCYRGRSRVSRLGCGEVANNDLCRQFILGSCCVQSQHILVLQIDIHHHEVVLPFQLASEAIALCYISRWYSYRWTSRCIVSSPGGLNPGTIGPLLQQRK